ncbi:MAG TPA: hypothetical protein VE075_10645 [Thermoanaerobaculia bacterium]|nr:hypothetical protein [Thermoanaerobaculia bacterium]
MKGGALAAAWRVLAGTAAFLVFAAGLAAAAPPAADEFFIISSIDAARARIVLKRPTEVTLVMRVTGRTAYRDEQGRPLALTALRAGDTVYITAARGAAGELTAVLVRQGPMTVQELQRRYFAGAAPP